MASVFVVEVGRDRCWESVRGFPSSRTFSDGERRREPRRIDQV